MEIFGFILPLWTVFLGVIVIAIVAWKLIKFAIKILLILVVFFAVLIGLDLFHVFDTIQQLLSGFI
ncbi:MAG: hypothetical protein DRO67_04400 [Candidatus Asgardarchaeum californiense]|nr:MAG: hypothetical protein DRO67_04400 [Candidatus Asgardarchaeum californiense]